MLFVAGLFLIFLGFWWYEKENSLELVIEEAVEAELNIHVSGAVNKVGVYSLPPGSRVKDALISAGGLSADADREYVEQNLNLADKLVDGQKIFIPGEERAGSVVGSKSSRISLNRGTQEDLESLEGIGPSRAVKIIQGRPYKTIEEVYERKIISENMYLKIKDNLILW